MPKIKLDLVVSPQIPQAFPFPTTIIKFITDKPQRPKAYFKLINSCKYFYYKNHIILTYGVYNRASPGHWNVHPYHKDGKEHSKSAYISLEKFPCKLWILNSFTAIGNSHISEFIPKIYRSDITDLYLKREYLTLKDFVFISRFAEELFIKNSAIVNDDKSYVQLETILGSLNNFHSITYCFPRDSSKVHSSNTMKEIAKLDNHKNLKNFLLDRIPEDFDLDAFIKYFEDHKTASFEVWFGPISDERKVEFDSIIQKLLQKPMFQIYYPGMDKDMRDIIEKKLKPDAHDYWEYKYGIP